MAKNKVLKKGRTIRAILTELRLMLPRRSDDKIAQLYTHKRDTKAATRSATLYVLIKSTERTHALHSTLFDKSDAMTPIQWRHYFATRVLKGWNKKGSPAERDGILRGVIIPAINVRTSGKLWSVQYIVGFHCHAIHKSAGPALVGRRNKTKSQRRKNGHNNIRRRHRNRSRKAK